MMMRPRGIWAEKMSRAVSVRGEMSPKPTVEKTLMVKVEVEGLG